jgi:hypothetical protein
LRRKERHSATHGVVVAHPTLSSCSSFHTTTQCAAPHAIFRRKIRLTKNTSSLQKNDSFQTFTHSLFTKLHCNFSKTTNINWTRSIDALYTRDEHHLIKQTPCAPRAKQNTHHAECSPFLVCYPRCALLLDIYCAILPTDTTTRSIP